MATRAGAYILHKNTVKKTFGLQYILVADKGELCTDLFRSPQNLTLCIQTIKIVQMLELNKYLKPFCFFFSIEKQVINWKTNIDSKIINL